MKCPQCSKDHKRKEGMTCTCGYRFAIDPKEASTYRITDGKLMAAVRGASGNGTFHFTKNQLYSRMAKNMAPTFGARVASGIIGAVFIGGSLFFGNMIQRDHGDPVILLIPAILFLIGCFCIKYMLLPGPGLKRKVFDTVFNQWKSAGKEVPGLVEHPRMSLPPPQWEEDDIYSYGVERILVVQHDILVDLLVLNEFHAQQGTLVLSEQGYPIYLVKLANRFLDETPDLPIYLLHDSTPEGALMKGRVETSKHLRVGGHPVIDLGIFPNDVKRMKVLRPLQPKRQNYAVPVDYLPYPNLSGAIGVGLLEGIVFAEMLDRAVDPTSAQDSGSSFG